MIFCYLDKVKASRWIRVGRRISTNPLYTLASSQRFVIISFTQAENVQLIELYVINNMRHIKSNQIFNGD